MSIDERSRHELYLRLEDALGPEPANTLMEHLPPVGWADVATRHDLETQMGLLRTDLEAQVGTLRTDLEAFKRENSLEFALVRKDIEASRLDVIGTLRGELMAQNRAMFVAIVTIVLTMSGLSAGLVALT